MPNKSFQEIIASFNQPFQNGINQSFQTVNFGSDLEAGLGGSAASFRASDKPNYVSKVLTEFPVSYIYENPKEVQDIKELHKVEETATLINDATTSGGESITGESSQSSGGWFGSIGSELNALVQQYVISGGVLALAIVLVLGGLVIIAMQNDTINSTVKGTLKKGGEALAA